MPRGRDFGRFRYAFIHNPALSSLSATALVIAIAISIFTNEFAVE
jgi:hypothetical protein